MIRIPLHEEIIIGGDLNGRVGKDRSNFEREHGGHGYVQKTQKEKASSALLRHITWWWQHILSKERRSPNNIQKWGPVLNSRLHHHQKRETKGQGL